MRIRNCKSAILGEWKEASQKLKWSKQVLKQLLKNKFTRDAFRIWAGILMRHAHHEAKFSEVQILKDWTETEESIIKNKELLHQQNQINELGVEKFIYRTTNILEELCFKKEKYLVTSTFKRWRCTANLFTKSLKIKSTISRVLERRKLKRSFNHWYRSNQYDSLQIAQKQYRISLEDQTKIQKFLEITVNGHEMSFQFKDSQMKLLRTQHSSYILKLDKTLEFIINMKKNYILNPKASLAFDHWSDVLKSRKAGTKKLVRSMSLINVKDAFSAIRKDARDEKDIQEFASKIQKLDSILRTQAIKELFSRWRYNMFRYAKSDYCEQKDLADKLDTLGSQITTQLNLKISNDADYSSAFQTRAVIFQAWINYTNKNIKLGNATIKFSKKLEKSRLKSVVLGWKQVSTRI